MELPTKLLDMDSKTTDDILFAEEIQIYEHIKPSDVTSLIMEMLSTTDKEMDLDIALELINGLHWNLARMEIKRMEKVLDFNPYEMKEELMKAKKKTIEIKEI